MTVQLIANTIESACFFNVRSIGPGAVLALHRFCTTTSMARTKAARVKSTVRFLGRKECQYNIPANALTKEAKKVDVSLDTFPCPILLIIGSSVLQLQRM